MPWQQTGMSSNSETQAVTELVNLRHGADHTKRIDRQTRWGNPFRLEGDGGSYSREGSVAAYSEWFYEQIRDDAAFRDALEELRGETLACWCVGDHGIHDEPPVAEGDVGTPTVCHGEVLLQYFDRTESAEDYERALLAFASAEERGGR